MQLLPSFIDQAVLDLEVHVATTEADLRQACAVREVGYAHHLGSDTEGFATVEALDRASGTVVLLCRSHASGEVLGTVRVVAGDAGKPLSIEDDVALPRHIMSRRRAEVSRLAVKPGAPAAVKLCLMRAVYRHCVAKGLDWLVIAARNEALARNYRRLGFKDFLPPGQKISLACAGHLPHFIFTMDVTSMATQWRQTAHRWLSFMLAAPSPHWPAFQPSAMVTPPCEAQLLPA